MRLWALVVPLILTATPLLRGADSPLSQPNPTTDIGIGGVPPAFLYVDSFGPKTLIVPGQEGGAGQKSLFGLDTTDKSLTFQKPFSWVYSAKDANFGASFLAKAKADADLGEVLDGDVDPTWEIGGGLHRIGKIPPPGTPSSWLPIGNLLVLHRRETVKVGQENGGTITQVEAKHVDGFKAELQMGLIVQKDSWVGTLLPATQGNLAFSAAIGFERKSNAASLKETDFEGAKIRVGMLNTENRIPATIAFAYSSPQETDVSKALGTLIALIPGAKIEEGTRFVPVYGAFYTREFGDGDESEVYGVTYGFRTIKNGRYAFPLRLSWTRTAAIGEKPAESKLGVAAVISFF